MTERLLMGRKESNQIFGIFAFWVILHVFCQPRISFYNHKPFQKKKSGIPSVSNSLDPDQAQHLVCLKLLSNERKSMFNF